MHGKRRRRSPLKKDYPTRDFSPEATKGLPGDKFAKALAGDTSTTTGFVKSVAPVGKVGKFFKTAWSYMTS